MALDLGLTTHQLLSALNGVAQDIRSRGRRLNKAIDRALAVPAGEAASRTAAVGHRPHSSARAGPEGPQGSRPPPRFPPTGPRCPWTAPTLDSSHMDSSHIDVDRHPPRLAGHAASQQGA